jgi:hypothetical protein
VHRPEYDEVPEVPADAEPDEHVAALLSRTSSVPASYLPAVMGGPQPRWRRWAAVVLLTMLVTVTSAGICLTYGPEELFR